MGSIILYHGTVAEFNMVNLDFCNEKKDFGKGFYTTTDINQAVIWAIKKRNINLKKGINRFAYIYSFKVDVNGLSMLNGHKFQAVNIAWLDYILYNRSCDIRFNKLPCNLDWVYGRVADAKAQKLIDDFYICGDFSDRAKKHLINSLEPNNLSDQYCFKSQMAINFLNQYGNMQVRRL